MKVRIKCVARVFGAAGFAALSAVHVAWAMGSSWPAADGDDLADMVVGQAKVMPSPAPTAVVAAGCAGASLLASGALGHGKFQRSSLFLMGIGLLLRAILGGKAALSALRLPAPGERFQRLDRRYYRPLAALLALSLWIIALTKSTR